MNKGAAVETGILKQGETPISCLFYHNLKVKDYFNRKLHLQKNFMKLISKTLIYDDGF
jgi:hypothetical protein